MVSSILWMLNWSQVVLALVVIKVVGLCHVILFHVMLCYMLCMLLPSLRLANSSAIAVRILCFLVYVSHKCL